MLNQSFLVVSTLTTAFNDNNIDGLIEIDLCDITSNIFIRSNENLCIVLALIK